MTDRIIAALLGIAVGVSGTALFFQARITRIARFLKSGKRPEGQR